MNIKQIIVAAAMVVASVGAAAQEWTTSVGVSVGGPNGHISIGTTNGHPVVQGVYVNPGVYVQPGVIFAQPAPVYPTYAPQVIVVPCYNCGQYPQGNIYDPYRNHHHLQRQSNHHHNHR